MTDRPAGSQSYLQELDSTLMRLSPNLPSNAKPECKRFFGGAAAYVDGRIFMTLTTAGLALKLPENLRTQLLGEGGKPLRYFAKGHIKKEYVVLPDASARSPTKLVRWVAASMAYVTERSAS